MKAQTISTASGEDLIVITAGVYEALQAARRYVATQASEGVEDAEDIMTAIIIEEARYEPTLSAQESRAVMDRILGRPTQTAAE